MPDNDDDDDAPRSAAHRARNAAQRVESESRLVSVIVRAIKEELAEQLPRHFESVGMDITTNPARSGVRKDMEWVRRRREQGDEDSRSFRSKFIGVVVASLFSTASVGAVMYIISHLGGTHP